MIQKQLKFEIKSVSDEGKFTGFAAYYGNVDSDNEVLDPNCFKRSISHTKGRGIPVLWAHDARMPIAWGVSAEETKDGLQVEAQFLLNTEQGRAAYEWAKMGTSLDANVGISVGFRPVKDGAYFKDGRKHYREAQLAEYSLCVFQANDRARVATVKAEAKTKRVAGEDLTADCFAYVGDPDKTETWKLPIKFSSDAKTERHIRNALARFGQTQGIPDSERAAVLAKIRRAAKEYGIDTGKAQKDFNDSLAEAQAMDGLYEERCEMAGALCDAVSDALADDTMSADDKKADIAASYEQYAAAMSDWYSRFIDADTDNDTEEDLDEMDKHEKTGRAISAASAQQIKTAMGHLMDAGAMHQKALGILTDLSKSPYTANDVNADNPVGGGKSEAEELAEKAVAEAAVLAAKAKEDQEKSDSEALHSLLELTRSVADRYKAA